MNVLFVIPYPMYGGPHNEALRLAGPLQARGWNSLVLLPTEPGNAVAWMRGAGVDVVELPLHRLRATPDPRVQLEFGVGLALGVARIRNLIRARKIDLVLIPGLANPHAAIAGRLERIPVVWQILDSRTPPLLRPWLMSMATSTGDALMFTGQHLMDQHVRRRKLDLPTFVYYPPVVTETFTASCERRLTTRRSLGIPDEAMVVGMVANLNRQKGIEYFIRAASLIYAADPGVHFLIVGSRYANHPKYNNLLDDELTKARVPSGQFLFTDARTDLESAYPALDVALFTSVPRSEGITTTVLEAQSCSVPVVATDVGGLRGVIDDGETGFLVPPLDPQAIAAATLRIVRDAELRRRIGDKARQAAVNRYDVLACTEQHIAAFNAASQYCQLRRPAASIDAPPPLLQGGTPDLTQLLVCPACRASLQWSVDAATCGACNRRFPVADGIPVLLLDDAAAANDEIDHHEAAHHKARQATFFDGHDAEEFEVTRPHGAPRLYRWLMGEKFRRSALGIAPAIPGATVLTVCGGSGMDAEFLVRAGAHVISSDISLGAARRTQQRARRFGLPIRSIAADVENLPFRDRSVDIVYVHDGLHHLKSPATGVAEMARVATRAVSVTEPSRAALTRVAVRLGLALDREEAGNVVARLTLGDVASDLRRLGFNVVRSERYGMYYRHEPGRVFTWLSKPVFFALVKIALKAANKLGGRFGNKLTVQARREAAQS